MVMQTFTFSPNDVAATQRGIPPKLAATTFEALTAAIWRTRTAELELPADEEVRVVAVVNFYGVPELGLPAGYYGTCKLSAWSTSNTHLLPRSRSRRSTHRPTSFMDTSIKDAAATSSSAGGTSTRVPVKGFSSVAAAARP